MPTKKYTRPSFPLTPTSLPLGTLISNPLSPTTDALTIHSPVWGQNCSRHDDVTITTSGLAHLPSTEKHALARLFLGSSVLAKGTETELTIKAHHGFIYTLWKPKDWFSNLCSKPEVRKWLEATYASKKGAWLVVGCKTIVDAHFIVEAKKASENEKESENERRGEEEEEEWEFPGERIYALEIRKVEMRFFERTGEVLIWGPVWESHSVVLEGEGEVEVVEAILEGVDGEGEGEGEGQGQGQEQEQE